MQPQAGVESKPCLLVLASTYPRWPADAEPGFVHELAKRLVDRFQVTVLCPHSPGAAVDERFEGVDVVRYRYAPTVLEVLVNNGGIVNNLKRRPWTWLLVPGFILAQAWSIWRITRTARPAVVHAHWLIPQGMIVAMLGAIGLRMPPFLVTSHGGDLYALRGSLLSACKRFVLRRAASATVVSEGMLDAMGALAGDISAVEVQPMGVDLQGRFRPDPAIRRSSSEILFVGRLVEKKGLQHLLDAMPLLLASRPDARLTVVGFGPEEAERRRQAERLGISERVDFIGAMPQSGLPALYARAAVFVAPFVQAASGDQDGLGLVLVEALGCGCPVVVSRLPATEGLIRQCQGVRAVPPGDPAALAAVLSGALSEQLVVDVSEVVDFDWTRRAECYGDLLMRTARMGHVG